MKKNKHTIPEQIERLVSLLPDAVYLLNASGLIIYSNPAAQHHTGWDAEQLHGQFIADALVFALPFRSTVLDALRQQPTWSGESERILPDGGVRIVEAFWQLLEEPYGSACIIGIDRDITVHHDREAELEQSRKLATIGILSEGIAHELRNPLSYALSAAQLLNEKELPEEVREKCVQTVTTGVKRAGVIVENMLSLGKPRGRLSRQRVLMEKVVSDALEASASHANFNTATIVDRVSSEGLIVSGNHDMLVQVFHNIITNALNEMPDGGSITLNGKEDKDSVWISVQDDGPGIGEEMIEHLFDPFFSASSSGGGTGLGLTLSYYIMKEHAGTIEVKSELGSGSTFVLTFPLLSNS